MVKKKEGNQVTYTFISLLNMLSQLEYRYGANTMLLYKTLKMQQIMVVIEGEMVLLQVAEERLPPLWIR